MNKLLLIIALLVTGASWSQFGNEWIDYSQKYYSFKIVQDGVYKIDYATLNSAGLPLATISPENFQLFGFEQEQQIWLEDGGDGSFDPGDYILFYAKKNTTWLDSMMYDDPDLVTNRYYPHYNDTINYYLTWNGSTSNKRITEETDVAFGSYTAQPYFLKTNFIEYHNRYIEGHKVGGMSNSTYVNGEGWVSNFMQAVSTPVLIDTYVPTQNPYTGPGAPDAVGMEMSVGGSSAIYSGLGNHHFQLQYGASNTVLVDTIFAGYPSVEVNFSIPSADLGATSTKIRHQTIDDLGLASDVQAVAFVELTYPHSMDMGGATIYQFTVPYNATETKTHYALTNFISPNPIALTLEGGMKKIPVVATAGTYEMLIPNLSSGENQDMIILDEGNILDVSEVKPINGTGTFTNYASYDYNDAFIIVSHPYIWSSATEYHDYRESVAGGGYSSLLINIEELYHQFAGGVPKHVMGVRRFADFAHNQATTAPPHSLFLLGKAVREATENLPTGDGTRKSSVSYDKCLIPSFGYPASDNLITARLGPNDWEPLIPTGRLAASSNEDVLTYLSKVEEYENQQDPNDPYTIPSKYWQKDILHLGGGSNGLEQATFKYFLYQYEQLLEGPKFAGNVTSFYKTVSDPIDPVTLYEVTDNINAGVSLMTFFGHASADGFDQNVDDPENWDNAGKYPIVVGNACLTGNIHEPSDVSTSEEYVLIPDKGAIAFVANVGQAFSTTLHQFSLAMFTDITGDGYGTSLGENVQQAIQDIQSTIMSFGLLTVVNQMTLHGDPAIRMNPHPLPELEVNETSLFVDPPVIDLSVDSIDVNVIIYNMGQYATDTFAVELRRIFPNNHGDSLYTKQVNGIGYKDTVVFTIPFYNNIGIGLNEFEVSVDIPSLVDEQYDEVNNNQMKKQVFFDVDGIYPIWPYEYAVVPGDTITLKGSTVNPFADMAMYRFEIDTTDLFDSPELRYNMQSSLGGVLEVEFDEWINATTGLNDPLLLDDSVSYFWRVAVVDTGDFFWIESSFEHINNKEGWGQDHFFQFKNNDYLFLNYERPVRERQFGPAFKTIDCDVYGQATLWWEFAFTLYHIDGEIAEYNFCGLVPQIMVCVIDPVTLEPWGTRWFDPTPGTWYNPTHDFGNANDNGGCRDRVEYHFAFHQNDPVELTACQNMIENEIPDSFYYLIYTTRYTDFSSLDAVPSIYTTFQDLGSDSVYFGRTEPVPFIMFGKKGDPGSLKEVYADTINSFIHLEDTLWGYDYYGTETSTLIGPAKSWESMYWRQTPKEVPTDDSTRLHVYGVDWAGNKTLVIDTLFTSLDSIDNLAPLVDASVYPFMKLEAVHTDTTGFTPAQIDFWHVMYEHVPEAALDGTAGVHFLPGDTTSEGQQIEVAFDIKNVSDLPMDSLLISYWIEDAHHVKIPIPYPRQDSLRVGASFRDTITVPSTGLFDLNSFWVEVNPYVSGYLTDQPEQYHFNNVGQIPFWVSTDQENPILDVTFDGNHILNGDIVDPYSRVMITLKDENPYLFLNEEADTANFGLYLTYPDGNQRRLNFRNASGEPLLDWEYSSGANDNFKIMFDGEFEQDGIYRLLVQGADKSGNVSGDFDYDIEFEVIHESSITHLMNYPNPFSTQTQFVFTLTGSVVPDEFTIQILTVTGKVVREITVDELGPIHIGRNITDFRWDGTDEYGDQLANGVYLYRVITKIQGEDVEHRESGADDFFKKGFGKMYLMR